MESKGRERGRKTAGTPDSMKKRTLKVGETDKTTAGKGEKSSKLRDLCREDKEKVVGLISELKTEKERSRSVLAQRKADQERFSGEYRKLKSKYSGLKEDYEILQQKYGQSLELLKRARAQSKDPQMPGNVFSPSTVGSAFRIPGSSARRGYSTGKGLSLPTSADVSKHSIDDPPRKASEEVRDLRSMISNLSKSVRKLNDSYIRTQDPVVSLHIPETASPEMGDTGQSGVSVHLQPLNLNVLFEDPDHEERVSKVLAKARQTASKASRLKKEHAFDLSSVSENAQERTGPGYGDQFYALIQELEQAVAQ